MAGRKCEYLYRKADSQMWRIRLQYPDRPPVRKSLGTMDRAEAEILAMPMIEQHKRELYIARRNPNLRRIVKVDTITTRYPVGPSKLDDGTEVFATQIEAIMIRDGVVVAREDNFILNVTDITRTFDPDAREPKPKAKPAQKPVDNDRAMLEAYIGLRTRNKHYDAEARRTWDEFKAFVGDRTLAECTRADGHGFVAHLRSTGRKDATVIKLVNYLRAPIAHALPKHDPRQDIFHRTTAGVSDATERLGFDENDMRLMRDHVLPKLGEDERLMWLILATTGMRHAEAFGITEEFVESGIRYVRVGTKTESSRRSVPLPDCLLPHLPTRIVGPLFTDPSIKNVAKNLLRAVRRAGINDPRKVVYSLRHRAHTRLREAECDGDVQRQIVGHETGESHNVYGKSSLRVLKKWIDQIGY